MTHVLSPFATPICIIHRTTGRVRLKSRLFSNPSLDEAYLVALISAVAGVQQVRLNRAAASLIVEFQRDAAVPEEVLVRLRALPQDAFIPDGPMMTPPDGTEVLTRMVAALITPLLPRPFKALLSWFLALPTIGRGVETLLNEGLKVEVLDAGVRIFALSRRDYFVSNMVGALLVLAGWLEAATTQKANDLLKTLLRPPVDRVRVVREGAEIYLLFDQVMVGDQVICGPGEMIPVDGRVLDGEAAVNAASITGESFPQHIRPGDEVLSGGLLEEGKLILVATSVGSETRTARIARFLEKSLRRQSRTQQRREALADKLVPLTFGAGLGMYLLTGKAARAASVLTVDYSCAIKLATPVVVRTAMHTAGRQGVLLKGAQALEALAEVDTLVFDKTGTPTHGVLEVSEVIPLNDFTANEVLALAAGAETHYGHPAARAVMQAARELQLTLPQMRQVDFVVAHGVSAYLDGQRVLVGSRHFIHEDEGVDCTPGEERASRLRARGLTLLYLALEGRLAGLIALRDTLRQEAAQTLQTLKAEGIERLILLTGDHQRAADGLAARLPDLDEVYAELRPEDKARKIESLQADGHRVAFVGDGVNDSPALVTADVGICMPLAADLARDAAQVVLLRDDLHGLILARRIALRTRQTLNTCLWSAVGINSALLVLAGTGSLPTLAAAALHNASTVGILAASTMAFGDKALKRD